MPDLIKINFIKEKETPGTIRFKEVPEGGQPPCVGTLYVKKWFAGDSQALEMTLAEK